MHNTRPPVPMDLLRLRSATRAYLAVLRAVQPTANRLGEVAGLLSDHIDAALMDDQLGTPAGIAAAVAVLVGEA